MSKLSGLFGRRENGGEQTEFPPAPASAPGSAQDSEHESPTERRSEGGEVGTSGQIGEENEALRNLLIDAGLKIRQFEDYKSTFINLIEPATHALRTLENEKTSNIDLRRKLEQAVARCDELRLRAHELETRHAILVSDNDKLGRELELARLSARDAERARAEFASENVVKRSTIADLERQLALETSRVDALSDDGQRLREEAVSTEARANRLSAELASARDKIVFLEGEVLSVQKALDQVSEQATHAARRFADSEIELTTAKTRLLQLEASHGELQLEREKLRSALESSSTRHGSEQGRAQMQIDAVRSRAVTSERLLGEARQLLAARSEETRNADQRATEAIYARERADKRITDLEATIVSLQSEISELKGLRDRLVEKSTIVVNTLKLRETQLARAEDTTQSATERALRLEVEAREAGLAAERRIEELLATIERERLEREVTEGALDTARRERAQLQSELMRLQAEAGRVTLTDDSANMKFPDHGANAA
jgi:chromosome segregation ATPase